MKFTPSTMTRSLLRKTFRTFPFLPLSSPETTTTWSNFAYTTSGASEMIFMNRRSRSSRATGPKMRVPRGSF